MIGIWSAYASTFLILLAIISAVFLSIPIFIAPLAGRGFLGGRSRRRRTSRSILVDA